MLEGYRIIAARQQHLPHIPGLELAAAVLFSEDDLPGELRYMTTDPAVLRDAQRDRCLWVAETMDHRLSGFALGRMVGDGPHLQELAVHPDHMRRGLGRWLVETVREWAESGGHSQLTLVTFADLAWNAPWYRKLGFDLLPTDTLPARLQVLLDEEAELGIDVSRRVVMRLPL